RREDGGPPARGARRRMSVLPPRAGPGRRGQRGAAVRRRRERPARPADRREPGWGTAVRDGRAGVTRRLEPARLPRPGPGAGVGSVAGRAVRLVHGRGTGGGLRRALATRWWNGRPAVTRYRQPGGRDPPGG